MTVLKLFRLINKRKITLRKDLQIKGLCFLVQMGELHLKLVTLGWPKKVLKPILSGTQLHHWWAHTTTTTITLRSI